MGARFAALLGAACLALTGCNTGEVVTPPVPDAGPAPVDAGPPDAGPVISARCEIDFERYVSDQGSGAFVRKITATSDLMPGKGAQGVVGDWLVGNDKFRAVIQRTNRAVGPQPFGGNIIDVGLVGADMHDEFGETGFLLNFGRTNDAQKFEILEDGSKGGTAVLAVSGVDVTNDWLGIKNQIAATLGNPPVVDPDIALGTRLTHYYLVNPGEQRIRWLTAVCNDSAAPLVMAVGDLTDPGGDVEFFNPDACVHGFGYAAGSCFGLDPMSWYGYQGHGVAYGYAPYRVTAPNQPETLSAVLTVAGVTGSILSAPGLGGLLDWLTPTKTRREGQMEVAAGASGFISRDFVVGRDLGEVASRIAQFRQPALNTRLVKLSGQVKDNAGSPIVGARIAIEQTIPVPAIAVSDAQGRYEVTLVAGSYRASAWAVGRLPSTKAQLTLASAAVVQDFTLGDTRTLTVNVKDPTGRALPAKVSVMCVSSDPSGACTNPQSTLDLYTDILRDPLPDDMQAQAMVPPSGTVTLQVPPGRYQVLVSRGPTWSIWPPQFPGTVATQDLTAGDVSVNATLAKLVETRGALSADFHVHGVNSPDSYVIETERVKSYLAEGMDVVVATDHDFVTDLGPANEEVGGTALLKTVVGDECSPMDFGHYIVWPFFKDPQAINGGALDWTGGTGPTLTLGELFGTARNAGAGTIQFNHPRGSLGGFTYLRVDTDTLATHAAGSKFRMEPRDFTDGDTGLMSADFNAFEVLNAGVEAFNVDAARPLFNDWFTFLSRGLLVAAAGTSDTHQRHANAAGYWRTFVQMGTDDPSQIEPFDLSTAVNSLKATVTNGPFITFTAKRANQTAVFGPGGVVPPGTGDLELTVEIQCPEWMDVKRIELFTHLASDDAPCPTPNTHPNAATTRVACDGVANSKWPLESIFAKRDITLAPGDLRTVATIDGRPVKRYQRTETFRIPAPRADAWFVPFVYGESDLFPLVYAGVSSGKHKVAKPFALANPVFVDIDGNGWQPPVTPPPRPTEAPPEPKVQPVPEALRGSALIQLLRDANELKP